MWRLRSRVAFPSSETLPLYGWSVSGSFGRRNAASAAVRLLSGSAVRDARIAPIEGLRAPSATCLRSEGLRPCSSAKNSRPPDVSEPEVIHADDVMVEEGSTSSQIEVPYADAPNIDHFCRAKLMNYVKRISAVDGKFQTVEVKLPGGEVAHRSTIVVPVPQAYGPRMAEGMALTAKDAESLAAMHGTMIIDALGLQLYTLPSMQRKHAESSRLAGRWAPVPGDTPRPPATPSPPPLRKLTSRDETEDGKWALIDCAPRNFRTPSHTLLSPAVVDPNAAHRIRKLFERAATQHSLSSESMGAPNFDDWLSVFNSNNVPDAIGLAVKGAESVPMFTAELRLPLPDQLGAVVAKGKALDRSLAVTLACMHAELLLDAINFPLYFDDPVMQGIHAQAAKSFGRSAPLAGDALREPSKTVLPKPLKQFVAIASAPRFAPLSDDERLVADHIAFANANATFETIVTLHPDAQQQLQEYIARCHSKRTDPYFVERVGAVHRATIALPLPEGHVAKTDSAGRGEPHNGTGLMAMGVGSTTAEAEALAAMHAVETLCRMGVPIFADASRQAAFEERRRLEGHRVPGGGAVATMATGPPAPYRRLPVAESTTNVAQPSSGNAAVSRQQQYAQEQVRLAAARAEKLEALRANELAAQQQSGAAPKTSPVTKPPAAAADPAPSTSPSPPSPTATTASGRRAATVVVESDVAAVDYVKFRGLVTEDQWSLTPDSPDGYIVVSPKQSLDNAVSYGHTLVSPRQLDMLARERLVQFLQSMGKRPEAMIKTNKLVTFDNVPFYRTTIRLPVPAGFGERLAIGEANDTTESEILASMHAELVMDTLGLPWYIDSKQQRKHASAARRQGRFAPMPGDSPQPFAVPNPPPLRKERTDSVTWQKHVVAKYGKAMNVHEASVLEATEAPSWRANLRTAAFEAVAPDGIDYTSRERVRNYLRRVQRRSEELEYVVEAQGQIIYHIARMALPLPSRFGPRHAIGVALSKKEADALCWMHAERTIDALGVHLFNLPGLQRRHAERVAKAGRWAPLLGEEVERDDTHPSPLPLKSDDIGAKPKYPLPPADVGSVAAWRQYVQDAAAYVEARQKHHHQEFLSYDRVPRTGDHVLDDALDEVEGADVDKQAKSTLAAYCFQANVEYPTRWRSMLVGPSSARKTMTWVPVPGLEHIQAMGVGASKDVSHKRAAMHVLAILRRLDPDFLFFDLGGGNSNQADDAAGNGSGRRKKSDMGSWDRWTRSFTDEGKVRLINLFTVCTGASAPVVNHRQRNDGGIVSYVTTVEIEHDGRKFMGRATDAGRKINEPAAYDDLFSQLLQRVPAFGSLGQFLRTHPHLDPDHVVTLAIPKSIEDQINAVCPPPSSSSASADGSDDVADSTRALPVDASGAVAQPSSAEQQPSMAAQEGSTDGAPDGAPPPPNNVVEASTATLSASTDARDPSVVARISKLLKDKKELKLVHPDYISKFKEKKERLSIYARQEQLITTIRQHPVTVICGTTGCGKTTQVPQFILDAETDAGRGGSCSIIVTQPRRLSAVSIATRIAAERLEDIGDSVGYTIRLESRPGTNINFCTSGVLLRVLQAKPRLEGINYVIIDEIHERDINSDFLLILLKQLLTQRSDLRVILMSATLQSELFAGYFGGAPVINVEGYVHPVKELFLDDVVSLAKEKSFTSPSIKAMTVVSPLGSSPAAAGAEKYDFREASTDIDYAALLFVIDHVSKTEEVTNGTILVFLPGWDEITRARDLLAGAARYHIILLHSSIKAEEQMECFKPAPEGKIKLVLSTNIAESGVTIDDIVVVIDVGLSKEKSYFLKKGRTAVGKNEVGSMSQLVTILASRANCIQRRGRAGRTRSGVCVRMYSRSQFASLADFQLPEMLRQPLDSLCLQILALGLGDPSDFLQRALEPPAVDSIEAAMGRLRGLAAITEQRTLTPLGRKLALLPVSPRIGKMILFGAALRCLDSVLTIASCSEVDCFSSQREIKDVVRLNKVDFACNSQSDHIAQINAFNSSVNARAIKSMLDFDKYAAEKTLNLQAIDVVAKYRKQFFDILVESGFVPVAMIAEAEEGERAIRQRIQILKKRFLATKTAADAPKIGTAAGEHRATGSNNATTADPKSVPLSIPSVAESAAATAAAPSPPVDDDAPMVAHAQKSHDADENFDVFDFDQQPLPFADRSVYSTDATDVALVKSAICTGLFPNVAIFREKRLFRSKLENMLHPSPSSVVSKGETEDITNPFFVFEELMQSGTDARVMLKGVSNVSLWAALLMGANHETHVRFRDDLNLMILDDWIVFRSTAETIDLVYRLKIAFNECMAKKFSSPTDPVNESRLARLQQLVKLLVHLPLKPNAAAEGSWEEPGHIIGMIGCADDPTDSDPVSRIISGDKLTGAGTGTTGVADSSLAVDNEESADAPPRRGRRVVLRAADSVSADEAAATASLPPLQHALHIGSEDEDDRSQERLGEGARHVRQELERDLVE